MDQTKLKQENFKILLLWLIVVFFGVIRILLFFENSSKELRYVYSEIDTVIFALTDIYQRTSFTEEKFLNLKHYRTKFVRYIVSVTIFIVTFILTSFIKNEQLYSVVLFFNTISEILILIYFLKLSNIRRLNR